MAIFHVTSPYSPGGWNTLRHLVLEHTVFVRYQAIALRTTESKKNMIEARSRKLIGRVLLYRIHNELRSIP